MTAYAISAPGHAGIGARRVVNVRVSRSSRAVTAAMPSPATVRMRRVMVMLIVLALVAVFAPRAFAGSDAASGPADFSTYTVAQGETLWSIATAITGPGEDVRDTVAQMQTLNAKGDSSLRAGEQIFIPAVER